MQVTIKIIGGTYEGTSWTGELRDAPATSLIPEGIISARTQNEADRLRRSIATMFDGDPELNRVEVGAIRWAIRVTREVS